MNDNFIRSSQLLTPFGIGQIVSLPKEVSYMICGLDLWDEVISQRRVSAGSGAINELGLRIIEPRLQELLDVSFFVKPFEYRKTGTTNKELFIPSVRFPSWHYCTNMKCGKMRQIELTLADAEIKCSSCSYKMIPIRFVAVCSHGHIQDVPFMEWTHDGENSSEGNHALSYHSMGGSGDLGSIQLKCSCGKKRSLAGIMNVTREQDRVTGSALSSIGVKNGHQGEHCKGHRPWLGLKGIKDAIFCGNHLQVLVKGGSNVHYSDIISALYLPETNSDLNENVVSVIKRIPKIKLLELYNIDGGTVVLPSILSVQIEVLSGIISKEELLKEVLKELNRKDNEREIVKNEVDLRYQEYKYILKGRISENDAFKASVKSFDKYFESDLLRKYFDCVVLIEKLRETRVYKGFSRINPSNKINKSELSNEEVRWLPAIEVFGEGIFLKFNDTLIDEWTKNELRSIMRMIKRYSQVTKDRRPLDIPRRISPPFIMMHTFAHLLIKRLCFSCGYGSSSLRERIYFSDKEQNRMNGILIYTSSGDSEGSLGGLVRQGTELNLARIVLEAMEEASWCSADPVCSDIGQSSGQGPDNINGSACHNCCLLPETSCEEFNMLLDRSSVKGVLGDPSGYFDL